MPENPNSENTWKRALVKAGFWIRICLACCLFCSIKACAHQKIQISNYNPPISSSHYGIREIAEQQLIDTAECNKQWMKGGNHDLHLTHDVVELVFGHSGEARRHSVAGNLLSRHSFLHSPDPEDFHGAGERLRKFPNSDLYLGIVSDLFYSRSLM